MFKKRGYKRLVLGRDHTVCSNRNVFYKLRMRWVKISQIPHRYIILKEKNGFYEY